MTKKITIFYDGSCGFCRNAMKKLQQDDKGHRLVFEATAPASTLVVKDEKGRILTGVDAFSKIWSITGHPVLSILCRWKVSRPIAKIIYRWISQHRHLLNNGKDSCDML